MSSFGILKRENDEELAGQEEEKETVGGVGKGVVVLVISGVRRIMLGKGGGGGGMDILLLTRGVNLRIVNERYISAKYVFFAEHGEIFLLGACFGLYYSEGEEEEEEGEHYDIFFVRAGLVLEILTKR